MSRISVNHSSAQRGFTLTELMVSLSISAIVMGGVLAAYLFLGRNLERMMFLQQQQVENRRAVRNFTQDLSATVQLTTATASQIALTKTITGGTSAVTYTYTAPTNGSTADGKVDRVENSATTHLLTHLTSFTFSYFTEAGVTVTNAPQSVKSVEFNFASSLGSANNGTSANFTAVSPRVVLRNRAALQ